MSYFPASAQEWAHFLGGVGVKPVTAANWAAAFADEVRPDRFRDPDRELDDFLGTILHESGRLERMAENLNYSAQRIREVGHGARPGTRWARAVAQADDLGGHPEALAEVLYGGRFGNVNPGDGWRFRARGPLGCTFAANYERVGRLMGQDLTSVPELLLQPRYGLQAALLQFRADVPLDAVDDDERVRRAIQGGTLGVEDVAQLAAAVRGQREAMA